MYNYIFLVGKLLNLSKLNNNVCKATLACTHEFKNLDGEYDVDYIPVHLPICFGEMLEPHLNKLVGLKGRIIVSSDSSIKIMIDRIAFTEGVEKGGEK